jgi:hypothetical protein
VSRSTPSAHRPISRSHHALPYDPFLELRRLESAPQGGEETKTSGIEVGNRQRMAGPAFGRGANSGGLMSLQSPRRENRPKRADYGWRSWRYRVRRDGRPASLNGRVHRRACSTSSDVSNLLLWPHGISAERGINGRFKSDQRLHDALEGQLSESRQGRVHLRVRR